MSAAEAMVRRAEADSDTAVYLEGHPFFVRTSLRTNAPAPACPRDERRGTSEPSGPTGVGKRSKP